VSQKGLAKASEMGAKKVLAKTAFKVASKAIPFVNFLSYAKDIIDLGSYLYLLYKEKYGEDSENKDEDNKK